MLRISRQSMLQISFLFNGRPLSRLAGQVGRLSPSETTESLMPELVEECQQKGLEGLKKVIQEESVVLDRLQEKRSHLRQEIQAQCVDPAISRVQEGYSASGLFWSEKQAVLRRIIDPKEYRILEEQIDWLTTRQELFEQMKDNNNYRPA